MNTSFSSQSMLTSSEERLVFALQLLGDKTRYRIFKLLKSHDEMCVTEIAEELGVTVSAVSQQFRNFEILGIVEKKRKGQKICYLLKMEDDLVNQLISISEFGADKS